MYAYKSGHNFLRTANVRIHESETCFDLSTDQNYLSIKLSLKFQNF